MKSKPVLIKEAILVDQEIETIDECLEISGKLLVDNQYIEPEYILSLIQIRRCRRSYACRFRWAPYQYRKKQHRKTNEDHGRADPHVRRTETASTSQRSESRRT